MRVLGITYDTGWVVGAGNPPERSATAAVVRRELLAIRDDLGCNAVRVTGGDPDQIELAASSAAELGLQVWVSPYPLDFGEDEMLDLFRDCAGRAEALRRRGGDVTFVVGAELSIMARGFIPGDGVEGRVQALLDRATDLPQIVVSANRRLRPFLARAVEVVRDVFGGPLTYASVQFEQVDWTLFDLIGIDLYRSDGVAVADLGVAVRQLAASTGKPVVITEVGCASYRGAAEAGALATRMVQRDPHSGAALGLAEPVQRAEDEQAAAIIEYLDAFVSAGAAGAFVFLLAQYDLPHRPDVGASEDLDRASYGIVRVLDDGALTDDGLPWVPKLAFDRLADFATRAVG